MNKDEKLKRIVDRLNVLSLTGLNVRSAIVVNSKS